jgi:hypothetical protein
MSAGGKQQQQQQHQQQPHSSVLWPSAQVRDGYAAAVMCSWHAEFGVCALLASRECWLLLPLLLYA